MNRHTKHPAYRAEMELLALLSPTPAPLELLRRDLGMETHGEVRQLIGVLRGRGFDIATPVLCGVGHAAVVRREHMPRIDREAGVYFDTVYPLA